MSNRALLLLLVLAGCARQTGVETGPAVADATPARAIVAMMDASAEAWNRGDLDAFVGDYAANATFVGAARVIEGSAAIRKLYEESYWKGGSVPKDALRFEDMEVQALGSDHALAVGRFVLYDRTTRETRATGIFSLVLRRTADGWRILHDHSS